MSSWSIEKELCALAQCDDLQGSLHHLGLLEPTEQLGSITVDHDWRRGGAETHIYSFSASTTEGATRRFIIKAHTPTPAGVSLEASFQEQLKRRRLLADAGVSTPRLYGAGGGVVVEDWIPFELRGNWGRLAKTPQSLENSLTQLFVFAIALDEFGFAPVSPFCDIRVDHSSRIYAIDFGQDLGPAHVQPNRRENERELHDNIPLEYRHACATARAGAAQFIRNRLARREMKRAMLKD